MRYAMAVCLLATPALVFGQSLGDAAQKEKKRREELKSDSSKPPVITDDQLKANKGVANNQPFGEGLDSGNKRSLRAIGPSLYPPFPNSQVEPTFAALIDLKVEAIRLPISWNLIEVPKKGRFDWAGYDDVISRSRAAGIRILGLVEDAARWSNGNKPGTTPPKNFEDYYDFLRAVVARYKPGGEYAQSQGWTDGYGIRFWEIWNEPNIPFGWQPKPDVVAYTTMLKGSYDAIKSVDPFATVAMAGLSITPTGPNSPTGFLTAMYDNGARGKFDAANVHPYVFTNMRPAYMQDNVTPMRDVMNAHGDQAVPIWATEFGYKSPGGVGAQQQADFLVQTYRDVLPVAKERANLAVVFWFCLRDRKEDGETWGLLTDTYEKKPAYMAFRDNLP
jgi:hypothetical protein